VLSSLTIRIATADDHGNTFVFPGFVGTRINAARA
jgi:hypothetical protein